jgi:hypothetical protein
MSPFLERQHQTPDESVAAKYQMTAMTVDVGGTEQTY